MMLQLEAAVAPTKRVSKMTDVSALRTYAKSH
jgi:hypothetical protein